MTDFKPEDIPEEEIEIKREILIAIYVVMKAFLIGLCVIAIIILLMVFKNATQTKTRCLLNNSLDVCKTIERQKTKQLPSKEESHERN